MAPVSFTAGEAVEISHDDEWSGVVWFEARVLRPLAGQRRYSVAFKGGAGDSRPLSKMFAATRLRPRPPRRLDPGEEAGFDLHQLVEALHDEGWREGVISRVPEVAETGRYGVYFPISRVEMEFGSLSLRPRLDWVDGEWVTPKEKGTTETMYTAGTKVEVAHVWKKIPVAWYTANVVKVISQNIFLVEYVTLRTKGSTLLREIVDSRYVRPCPPHSLETRNFGLLDEVEAFYRCGWWPGVVAKVYAGSRYNVKFMHLEEEIKFSNAQLRTLYEWIDGQWVQASQDKFIKSQKLGAIKSAGRKKLLYASNPAHDCKVPVVETGHIFPTHATNSERKNHENFSFQSQQESSQPCKKSKKRDTIGDNTLLSEFLMVARGTRTSSPVKTGFDVTTPIIQEEPNFCIKAMREKCSHANRFQEKHVERQDDVTEILSNTFPGEINNEPLAPAKSSQESLVQQTPLSMIGVSDKRKEFSISRGERPESLPKTSGHPSSVDHETLDFLRTVEGEKCKNASCTLVSGQQRNKVSPHHQLPQSEVPYDNGLNQLSIGVKRRKRDRPRRLKIRALLQRNPMECQQDNNVEGGSPVEGLLTSQVEAITPCDTFTNCTEAEPLNGMVSSSDGSFVESSLSGIQPSETGSEAQNVVPCPTLAEEVEKRALIEKAIVVIDPERNKSHATKSVCLPFDKCSSMWESIESMEVFSAMPQQPHFRPLEQYSKEFREGMAIGLMVTFSNLVESIGELWITDPRCKFDEVLKTLEQLEGHGFDIQCIQTRLKELLTIKANQDQLVGKRSATKVLILEKENKKDQLNAEIEAVEKTVMDLTQALIHSNEKKNSVLKEKEDDESKLALLQRDAREVEDAILSVENDFEAILAAAW